MAGGRNRASRAPPPKPVVVADNETKRANHGSEDGPPLMPITPPKHMPIPDIPRISELGFETLMLVFGLVSLALQYLNIYRTVFWLPHSHTKFAMNLYLIDGSVVWFIVITLSRRLAWSVLKLAITHCLHQSLWSSALNCARFLLFFCDFSAFFKFYFYSFYDKQRYYLNISQVIYSFLLFVCLFTMEVDKLFVDINTSLSNREQNGYSRDYHKIFLSDYCAQQFLNHSPNKPLCHLFSCESQQGVLVRMGVWVARMALMMNKQGIDLHYSFLLIFYFLHSCHYDSVCITIRIVMINRIVQRCFICKKTSGYSDRRTEPLQQADYLDSLRLSGWTLISDDGGIRSCKTWNLMSMMLTNIKILMKAERKLYCLSVIRLDIAGGGPTMLHKHIQLSASWNLLMLVVFVCVCGLFLPESLLNGKRRLRSLLGTASVVDTQWVGFYNCF
ncbi:unnamed protein product, partial [Meganyctiphanes norvegica]